MRRARLAANLAIVGMTTLTACGPDLDADFSSLVGRQPFVLSVAPGHGSQVTAPAEIAIRFSRPVDPTSVHGKSVFVLSLDPSQAREVDEIVADLEKEKLRGIPGAYQAREQYQLFHFEVAEPLIPGRYGVLVTTDVRSGDGMPLSQHPGWRPTPFWSEFEVVARESQQTSEAAGRAGDGDIRPDGAEENQPPAGTVSPTAPSALRRPAVLVINELLYDITGSDEDGRLFIELAGEAGADLSQYAILFINGDGGAVTDEIKIPKGATIGDDGVFLIADAKTGKPNETYVQGADLIANFDPQNGPDCVQLLDDRGELIDALGYGAPLPARAANGLACVEGSAAADAPLNSSLSRRAAHDTDDNAGDFIVQQIPTPGIL